MKVLLVGSTGLVGREVLDLALGDPRFHAVVALTRKPLPLHPKLAVHIVDFDALPPEADFWRADAVICTLGTTMRAAGSRAAFRRVDHDYPLAVARLARRGGASCFVLNSATGADPGSIFFYNRIKGELERDLETLGYPSITFVRPGLIGGARAERRPVEEGAAALLRILNPVLPRRLRINPAPRIARALLDAAIEARPGVHVVGSADLA